jgi:hypothetical protein
MFLVGVGMVLEAQDSGTGSPPRNVERARKLYEARLARYKASPSPDELVLPGLVANRKTKQIELLAESTGLSADSNAEFLLIDQASGHGYEAILWSYAKPSDVHAALVFVGMQPGAPCDPAQLRFWPKGERVMISIVGMNLATGMPPLRIETLILDKKTGKPMEAEGFPFTGSIRVPAPQGSTGVVYAADHHDPMSIVSLYNETGTVMDVPRQAGKGAVYGSLVVSPDHAFAAGDLLTLILEPERKDGLRRVKDLVLEVRLGPAKPDPADLQAKPAGAGQPLAFSVRDVMGKDLVKEASLDGALASIAGLLKEGSEPYVSIRFDGSLPLSDVRRTCGVISVIESNTGIRFEPPQAGQLYYKVFLPDEQWRDAKKRFGQPWELHLAREKGIVSGKLVLHEAVWAEGSTEPVMKVTSFDVATPKALREQLDADAERRRRGDLSPDLPVLLIYSGGDLTYGELVRFITPALGTHNTVHVFLQQQ